MATVIKAKDYKIITGLSTKTQGIYFAKKLNIKTNRKIKNERDRYIDFLTRLRLSIEDHDTKKINDNIIKNHVNKFIIDSDNNPDAVLNIKLDQLLNRKIKSNVNGKNYIREANAYITNSFLKDILRNINDKNGKFLMLKIKYENYEGPDPTSNDKKYYVVNNLFMDSLSKDGDEEEFYDGFGEENMITEIKLYYVDKVKAKRKLEGGFFKFKISEKLTGNNCRYLIDILDRYQIYTPNAFEQGISNINDDENCLIHSLNLLGINKKITNKLKLKCKSSVIPLKEVENFALENDITIYISGDKHNYKYGKGKKEIKLCLLEDHYFINEEVDITNFSLKNYEKIKDQPEWWKITGIKKINNKDYYRRENKGGNNSFRLVKQLFECNYFERIKLNSDTISLVNYNKINLNDMDLDNSNDNYKEIEPKKEIDLSKFIEKLSDKKWDKLKSNFEDEKKKNIKIAFDFETTTNTENHKQYLVSTCIYNGCKKLTHPITFIGEDCGIKFLEYIYTAICKFLGNMGINFANRKNETDKKLISLITNEMFDFVLLAHNITYDLQFLMKYVFHYNPLIRGSNKVCGGSFIYKGLKIKLKDTYAILDCKLASFKDFFKMDIKKEIMPYEIYTEENVKKNTCEIKEAIKYIKDEEDRNEFLKNIEELKLKIGDDHFNHMGYAKFYCERDIQVMMDGYFIFRSWVLAQMRIDIDNFLTISSIADQYFKLQGCYKDCYYINGIARYYIQKSVVGGRCMSKKNKKYLIEEKLNDFDGVSLYPSAMKRLGEIGGYLKGEPHLIEKKNLNMKFLDSVDGYFIRIKLNKVRTRRDFPLISYVNKDGIRIFTNDLDETNNILFVNKISLEDLKEFHDIKEKDYDILDGYFFNDGRNNKINETIVKVFNLRLKFKAEGNPIQNLYKLIMNSSYGKTIMKEQNNKLTYVDNDEDKNKYISSNYNHILEIQKLHDCEKYLIKTRKSISEHSNACQIGSEILSMSKRIMNEVMCLAEDNDVNIYYQDTDSMHMENDKINELDKIYKKKYKRSLIGKNLGQFHCDFQPIKVDDKDIKAEYSIKTIILGKKAYLDIVKYENGDLSTHYRMKGIPQDIVKIKAIKDFKGNLFELYKSLYEGNSIEFDLLENNKPIFKFGNGVVTNSKKFTRKLYFKNEDNDEESNDEEEDYDEIFDKIEDF